MRKKNQSQPSFLKELLLIIHEVRLCVSFQELMFYYTLQATMNSNSTDLIRDPLEKEKKKEDLRTIIGASTTNCTAILYIKKIHIIMSTQVILKTVRIEHKQDSKEQR